MQRLDSGLGLETELLSVDATDVWRSSALVRGLVLRTVLALLAEWVLRTERAVDRSSESLSDAMDVAETVRRVPARPRG